MPWYSTAAANTDVVGKQISLLIEALNDFFGEDINNNTHIVGFSLGAHVAGMAGYYLSGYLGRITGKFEE